LKTIVSDLLMQRLGNQPQGGRTEPRNRALTACLRGAILDGTLRPGSRLPATRDMAAELRLSRNTVMHAYDQLLAEGYLRALTGSGTYVADVLPEAILFSTSESMPSESSGSRSSLSRRGKAVLEGARASSVQWGAFVPGVPDVTAFPHRRFTQIVNRLYRRATPHLFTYSHGGGSEPLRLALADHLRTSRAVNCEPSQILVTEGVHQAIDLIVRVLGDPGDEAWLEEPGYWGIRNVLDVNGIRTRPVPVHADGIRIPNLRRGLAPRFIFVTPSHQYPLGPVMSLARRRSLLSFAERYGSWIVEDDYDSEFRFSGSPIPSLQGLVPQSPVLYVGTFSKTMYPGLRMAYVVVPEGLADAFRVAHAELYREGHLLMQAAVAEFIESGQYAAHIRRMRLVYASRRATLIGLTDRWLGPQWRMAQDNPAGLHLVLGLPSEVDDVAVAAMAASQGVIVRPLSRYYTGTAGHRGLLLGFGCVPEESMAGPFETLVATLDMAMNTRSRKAARLRSG
jgi:GntR family transcriptional regulator/MocR family aminotransferase